MAKKTAVRNVESNAPKSNAVTIPDQAARLIEGLVEKTGLRRETVLRRVLEVGLETLHRNIDDPLPPNATPFRESGKSEKWSVRNHEIDIAASDFVDNAIEVFTALTPANGPWIIKGRWPGSAP